jgi:hypothetical protein
MILIIMKDFSNKIIDGVEMIDLQGQLERLKDNYRKLKKKQIKSKLTWSEYIMYDLYPELIIDQEEDIKKRGRYVPLHRTKG